MNDGDVSKEIAAGLLAPQEGTEAAIHYVAEIIGQFDLVGVVGRVRDFFIDEKGIVNTDIQGQQLQEIVQG